MKKFELSIELITDWLELLASNLTNNNNPLTLRGSGIGVGLAWFGLVFYYIRFIILSWQNNPIVDDMSGVLINYQITTKNTFYRDACLDNLDSCNKLFCFYKMVHSFIYMIVYWFYKWNCIPLSPSIWPQILQYQTDKDTFKDNWLLCNLIRIKFLSNFRPIGMAILLTGLREACMIPGCTIRFHLFDSANTIIKYHYNWNNSKQILLQIQWLIEVWLSPSSFFS